MASLSWDDCPLLVESVGDYAIFMLDADGHVASWNLGAEKIKGYTASEIIGEHFSKFYPAEDLALDKPRRELEIARETGRFEDEGWRVRKDGSRFWANVVITALYHDGGKLRGFGKVTRDLTARRSAEETERMLIKEQTARAVAEDAERRLRESEARYRALSRRLEIVLEGVADGITVQDRTGRVVFANTAAAKACGFSSVEELLNTPPAEIVARFEVLDDRGQPFRAENLPGRRVLAGEPASSAILHSRERRTGREWWSFVRASGVLGTDGETELAVNIWHDVTAEHRREQETKFLATATAALTSSLQHEAMLSTLANVLVPDFADWCSIHLREGDELRCVTVAHTDPTKRAAAKEYEQAFPPRRDGPRGVWTVARTGVSELYNDITDEMLVGAARSAAHLDMLRAVGMKAVLLVPVRIRHQVIGVLTLVSAESDRRYDHAHVELVEELGRRAGSALENARLYTEAQDAATRAEEASRAKEEFLATVSHELRTPLNAIVGWSTLLLDRAKDPAVAKGIEVIHRNAQAQVKIIDDILDVSRIITGKFRLDDHPVNLVGIVRDAIEVVRPSAIAKTLDITFVPEHEICLLIADPERLQQVVWNLLSNAVKFTDAGGNIVISIRQEGSNVLLSVKDTGRGIDPAFLPFVFDRFRQADGSLSRRVGGLGLGLAIVRHIVELHGGCAIAESGGPDKGSTLSIQLPIRAVAPAAAPERPSRPRAERAADGTRPALEGISVLVVDDETDARDLLAAALTDGGATVQTAASASEGFAALKRLQPDVLVSDIGMPDEDGLSFMSRVRKLPATDGGRIPSVALTAYAREEDRTRALAAGFTTHIGKPVNLDALLSAVANLAAVTRR